MARKQALGPATLKGSKKARQFLVVILEALSGECGTSEAAERLKISLSRYYQLETRALQGMLTALEPRPRGPSKSAGSELERLKRQVSELERELRRQRSLVRAAARSVGLPAVRKKKAKKQRGARGQVVLKTLKEVTAKEELRGPQERVGAVAPGDSSQ